MFPCLQAMYQVKIAILSSPVFGSTQGSGRQTSFYIEICMEIDELNSNRYVGTKKLGLYNTMALEIASELANSTISYDF